MDHNLLKIKNLGIRYTSTDQSVVSNFNLSLNKGEVVAILGPSGSGKTTILNVISDILDKKEVKTEGEIYFSKPLRINTVFQESRLLPWRNVLRNVSYGLEAKDKNTEEVLAKSRRIINLVGLSDFESYAPSQLSIGMQQRVNFARAVVCEPDLLLMDEPFSALDVETKEKIQKQFLKVISKNKITSIFVTHNKDEAFLLADRIIILSQKPAKVSKIIYKKDFYKFKNSDFYINPYEG